ncbi:MAG: hypothetical protein KKF57_08180 [Firmicutes bacterium]|nr:hypothetical protein [Bacillota bacterium]
MIFGKALEFEQIKKDPTEFAYLEKDKKNRAFGGRRNFKVLGKGRACTILKNRKEEGVGVRLFNIPYPFLHRNWCW